MARTAKSKKKKIEATEEEVLNYLKIKGQFAMAERDVIERKTVAEAARKDGIRVTNGELQKAADGFRALMDLAKARETKRWLNKTGLSVEALEDYLETNILKSKFMDRLEKKSPKFARAKPVRQAIRELAYRDWLSRTIS